MVDKINMELKMPKLVKSEVVRESWDVDRRLAELRLDREKLLKVRQVAIAASADATPFHPANAAGTLAYQHGTWSLRDEFVGDEWIVDRPNGVEAIRNDAIKVKVVFANVDIACDDDMKPRPRSRKGAGSERVCIGNLFESLPEYAPAEPEGWATYYLMVAEDGAAELTRPVVTRGTFTGWVERIYLSDGSDVDRDPKRFEDEEVADDFDPLVVRK